MWIVRRLQAVVHSLDHQAGRILLSTQHLRLGQDASSSPDQRFSAAQQASGAEKRAAGEVRPASAPQDYIAALKQFSAEKRASKSRKQPEIAAE